MVDDTAFLAESTYLICSLPFLDGRVCSLIIRTVDVVARRNSLNQLEPRARYRDEFI